LLCMGSVEMAIDNSRYYYFKIGHFYFGRNRTFLNWLDMKKENDLTKQYYK